MLASLSNKPRITSSTVDMEKLRTLPDNTFGRCYINFMDKYASASYALLHCYYFFPVEHICRQEG